MTICIHVLLILSNEPNLPCRPSLTLYAEICPLYAKIAKRSQFR